MQSRKRSREPGDTSADVHVEHASSGFRQRTSQKRSRIALAAERGGSVVSDDDDEADGVQCSSRTDDESGRDVSTGLSPESSDDDTDSDDFDEVAATQAVHRQFNEHRENIASEEGIIEEVFCRNFMCHAKLRIKLGPLINFIIGHNGSGKSAVLTALTMCLGGKATATNRGASLKSLIKEGEETATLAVKIKNQGEGAYRHQLYGDSITVERNFSRSGASGFKIKNSEDKVISTKKADLDDILDYFAFQLDNPINVLNQDMARQFLSNSTPGDKYKFFIRGTQLETLDNDYRLMEEHIDSIHDRLNARSGDINDLKQKVDDADAKRKRLLEASALQERITHTQRMHAWAQVEEQERDLALISEELAKFQQKVRDKQQIGVDKSAEYEGQDQSCTTAKNQVAMVEDQLAPIQAEHTEAKEEFEANREKLYEARAEQRNIKEDVQRLKKNTIDLQGKIEDEQMRLRDAEGSEQGDRVSRLEELTEASELAKTRFTAHGPDQDLVRRKDDAEAAEKSARADAADKRDAVEKAEAQLNSMQQSDGRQFNGYHHNMSNLVRAVEQETRWRERPVGPLGKHIRLVNLDWQPQLERTFNDLLPAFAVTNKADKDLLANIMGRVGCQQTIFIGSSAPLDSSPNEPPSHITTILRVLRIDNDLVRNQLIINSSIEQIALTPEKRDAEEMVSGPNRVRNIKAAIAYGAHRGVGVRFEATRSGNMKTSPVTKFVGKPRMKTDRETQIRAEQQRVALAKTALNDAEKVRLQRRTAVEKANQDLQRFRRERQQLKVAMQQAEDKVQEQQQIVDDHLPQDGRLQELERQLTEVTDELESAQSSFQDSVLNVDAIGESGATLKARLDRAQSEVETREKRVLRAKERVRQAEADRHSALLAKNEALQAVEDAERVVARVQQRHEEMTQVVAEFCEEASGICARIAIEANVTPDILDKRVEELTQQYQQREREAGGTTEELTQAWQNALKKYQDALRDMNGMEVLRRVLTHSLAARRKRWLKFRRGIAARARINFGYLLSERKFRGEVFINHGDKELDIKVEPDMTKASDAGRETRTLSGGEKSFSTICLLLSIWEAMGSPIRCLDEFDVFMDSVNRQASMTMMIGAARRSVGRQFILITPQAMNNLTMGDDVRIYRMSDPERGQTTLPFERD